MKAHLQGILLLLSLIAVNVGLFKLVFLLLDLRDQKGEATVVIGSKAFTESIVLAEVMAQLITRRTDLKVERRLNLGGTHICFNALRAGEIDLYPEYTGTGLMAILEKPVISDPRRVLKVVRKEFLDRFELLWLEPMAFNNTYALAMSKKKAARLGIETISDLASHPGLSAGFTSEFMARADGYPGLKKLYALNLEAGSMEAGLMYGAAREGKVDVISAYATDGRIDKMKLRVLIDDKHFFPPYQAAPLIRRQTLALHPEIKRALEPLYGKLGDTRMRKVNADVDIDGQRPEQVASALVSELAGQGD